MPPHVDPTENEEKQTARDVIVIHELDPDISMWERQPKEPEKAFAAFVTYRDAGEDRTIASAAALAGKWRNQAYRWSKGWRWRERALAYDRHLDAAAVKAATKARRDMAARHAGLANGALGALQAPVASLIAKIQTPEFIADMASWKPREQLAFIAKSATAIKDLVAVERLSRGAPSDVVGTIGTTATAKTLVEAIDGLLREHGYDAETNPADATTPIEGDD